MMDAEGVRRFQAACDECPDKMDNAIVDMWLAVKGPGFALQLAQNNSAWCVLYGNEILRSPRQLSLLGERLVQMGYKATLRGTELFVSVL